jgi:hypothetical protein
MVARAAVSLLAALVIAWWLWRSVAPQGAIRSHPSAVTTRIVRTLLLFWCLLGTLAWLMVAGIRAVYPFELLWTGGALRDHCTRLLSHLPLYTAPTLDWTPLPLPPLHALCGAAAMSLLHTTPYLPLRLLSIVSVLGCGWILFQWITRLLPGRPYNDQRSRNLFAEAWPSRRWGLCAAGLFFLGYGVSGGWYDLETPDALFLFLCLIAALAIDRATARPIPSRRQETVPPYEGTRPLPGALFLAAIAGIALALALFTRQQAVVCVLAALAVCIFRRAWGVLGFFSLVFFVCSMEGIWAASQIWKPFFLYYTVTVPLSQPGDLHGALIAAASLFILLLPALALVGYSATAGRALILKRPPLNLLDADERPIWLVSHAPIATFGVFALLGGLAWRARFGVDGHLTWLGAILLTTAACALAGRWERLIAPSQQPVFAMVLAQALLWTYLPYRLLPTTANAGSGRRFVQVVQFAEEQGEMVSLDHGGVTRAPHAHRAALEAVINTEHGVPRGVQADLRSRLYAGILVDAVPDPTHMLDAEILRVYGRGEGPDVGGPWVVYGRRTPVEHHRIWILRRRR